MHPQNGSPVSNTRTPKDFSVPHACFCSVPQSCLTLWDPMTSLSFTISWSLLKLMFIELMVPSSHLILCHPLLPLPSIFPRVFSIESSFRIRWPKYWSFSFSMEKAMAPHSSTLAWKIPWTEEPGRLQSMGSLSQPRLSNFTFTFQFHALEIEMATHSSVLT